MNQFGLLPMVTITGDNEVVMAGPQIMIYPGPLLPNLQARPITDAGFEKIVQRGRDLGMFTGNGDFTPPDVAPGAPLGRIEIVVDGVLHTLTGDPSRTIVCITAPCNPAPGTPEAFATFWASLADLSWLAGDLGQEAPYVADAYAVLAGVEPAEQPSLHEPVAVWPLEEPLATFGKPIGSASMPRCGTARGEDATTLRPVLEMANQLTPWVDKGADDSIERHADPGPADGARRGRLSRGVRPVGVDAARAAYRSASYDDDLAGFDTRTGRWRRTQPVPEDTRTALVTGATSGIGRAIAEEAGRRRADRRARRS